jgi:hypothetical protein
MRTFTTVSAIACLAALGTIATPMAMADEGHNPANTISTD